MRQTRGVQFIAALGAMYSGVDTVEFAMASLDLNLLAALDVLLDEGSVVGAARRLGLSPSAMSRTLARLRAATGDPLLVRAGRGFVPTPRAAKLRSQVHALTLDAKAILSPQDCDLDLSTLDATFVLRTSQVFVELFSAALVAAVTEAAPRACLRFALKPDKDVRPLREGQIDLEIGVMGTSAPEVRTQSIFRDRYVCVTRAGHALATSVVTPEQYAACGHVVVSRKEDFVGPIDKALDAFGLKRTVACVVPGHADAMRIARQSDLIASVPNLCLAIARETAKPLAHDLVCFDLPVQTPEVMISAMWHPRAHADTAHRWLRETVIAVCRDIQKRAIAGRAPAE